MPKATNLNNALIAGALLRCGNWRPCATRLKGNKPHVMCALGAFSDGRVPSWFGTRVVTVTLGW